MNNTPSSSWRRAAPWFVMAALLLVALACAATSPGTLNDGKGKRDEPVPERRYARTEFYEIRTLNVLWPEEETMRPAEENSQEATATAAEIIATEGGKTPTPTPEAETGAAPGATIEGTPTVSPVPETYVVRVRYQVRCTKSADEICNLQEIARNVKLVDRDGVLYPPIFSLDTEKPLEGEILGDGEKTGWLNYEIPVGIQIEMAVAEYGQDQRVFFALAKQQQLEENDL